MAEISLIEYQSQCFKQSEIDEKIEEIICQNYDKYLKLEAPSYKNKRRWKLTAKGYIGTMNTADRSIALVDHALRRRFAFIELRPDYDILRKWHDRENTGFNPDSLIKILEKVNEAINDKHYEIGISFFLNRDLKNNIADIWELEIYPYLEELFYGDLKKIEPFCWKNIEVEIHHDRDSFDG
jgi:5-methylcytosine-specific restriction endonuclease McrBC GTP-binding regulatory subunit McrB